MTSVRIVECYCKGCGLCVSVCKTGALRMADDVTPAGFHLVEVVDVTLCTACGHCAAMCPEAAFEIIEETPTR